MLFAKTTAVTTASEARPSCFKGQGLGAGATEIAPAGPWYFADANLAKNPGNYCGIGGMGVTCIIDVGVDA